MSAKSRLDSLSPHARKDIEAEMRVSESQNKIVFRDFSVPSHHGRGKVNRSTFLKTLPGTRKASPRHTRENVDIISSHV